LRVIGYAFVLMLLYNIGSGGVALLPMQFVLKDRLKLPPNQIALLGILTDIPCYIGFALGFLRDRWRPFGRGDRGYFLLLPPLIVVTYLVLLAGPLSFQRIAATFLVITLFGVLLGAAANGLLAMVAQRNGMSGRIAVILVITGRGAQIVSNSAGGWLTDHARPQTALEISALLAASLLLPAFWKPRAVFATHDEPTTRAVPENAVQALRRLARSRAVYLPGIILFLWNFAPGWGTPLLYYLTNTVKLTSAAYGNVRAVLSGGALVFTLLYGPLCHRFRLRSLMIWGTVFGALGGAIFLWIHTPWQAYVVAFIAGGSCGIAVASYYDLLVRCCPRELEGAAFMFTAAMLFIAGDTSDLFGAWLYERGGFGLALAVTVATTALILPVLFFVPRHLATPREGEPLQTTEPTAINTLPETNPV
jgi:MFS family permease